MNGSKYFANGLPTVERCGRVALVLFCIAIAVFLAAGILGTVKLFVPAMPQPAYLIIVALGFLFASFALWELPQDAAFDNERP